MMCSYLRTDYKTVIKWQKHESQVLFGFGFWSVWSRIKRRNDNSSKIQICFPMGSNDSNYFWSSYICGDFQDVELWRCGNYITIRSLLKKKQIPYAQTMCFLVKEIIFLRQIKCQIYFCLVKIYFLILSWIAGTVIYWVIPQVFFECLFCALSDWVSNIMEYVPICFFIYFFKYLFYMFVSLAASGLTACGI